MGVVWLAVDQDLERKVALKFLPELLAADRQAIADLKRETRRSLELTHPHVVRIYDFVQDEGTAAISMEYVAGDTLASLKMDQPGSHFEPAALEMWIEQLCSALSYAHGSAGVVHRDLKPANLMVDARGDLKIADFGIAASVTDSVSRVSQQAGSSGTPVFMSPQQMMGERPAITDDIYAVGASLFDLLTGRPPFHSGNIMMQVLNKPAPGLRQRLRELELSAESIPEAWAQTIDACLAKEPEERPQSMKDLSDRLQGIAPSVPAPHETEPAAKAAPVKPPAAAPAAPAPTTADATHQKSKPLWPWIAVPAVLAIAAGGWWLSRPSANEPMASETETITEVADETVPSAPETVAVAAPAEEVEIESSSPTPEQVAQRELLSEVATLSFGASDGELAALSSRIDQYITQHPNDLGGAVALAWRAKELEIEAWRAEQPGFLDLSNLPAGLSLRADREPLGITPLAPASLLPGSYEITVSRPGYIDQSEFVTIGARSTTILPSVELSLASTSLELSSKPEGAEFQLVSTNLVATDLAPVERSGVLPTNLTELPEGSYEVRTVLPGWAPQTLNVSISRNEPGQLAAVFPSGSISVEPQGSGVSYVVEGGWENAVRREGTAPAQEILPVGDYTITLQKEKFKDNSTSFTLTEGARLPISPDYRGTTITITSDPNEADVTLDGEIIGKTPLTLNEVPANWDYNFTLSREDHDDRTLSVSGIPDESQSFEVSLTPHYIYEEFHRGKYRGPSMWVAKKLPYGLRMMSRDGGDQIDLYTDGKKQKLIGSTQVYIISPRKHTNTLFESNGYTIWVQKLSSTEFKMSVRKPNPNR